MHGRRIPPGIALADDYPIAGTLVTEVLREQSGGGGRRRRGRRRRRRIRRPRGGSRKSVPKKTPRYQERRKCPLRPLSSFEVHERLRRTKRRRSGYSLPFLLSRGVLPFPVEARNREPLHGPFTITIIVDGDRQKERRATARLPPPRAVRWGRNVPSPLLLPRLSSFSSLLDVRNTLPRNIDSAFLGQLFLLHRETSFFCSSCRSSSATSSSSLINFFRSFHRRPCERISPLVN